MSTTEITERLREKLEELIWKRDPPKTLCPSEVPRSFDTDELTSMGAPSWRDLMPYMRDIIWDLREKKQVEVLQNGKVITGFVESHQVQGPIRVRRRPIHIRMSLLPSSRILRLGSNKAETHYQYDQPKSHPPRKVLKQHTSLIPMSSDFFADTYIDAKGESHNLSAMDSYELPQDFLLGPGPEIQKEIIDFEKTKLKDYKGLYACVLDNVLSATECQQLIRAAESRTKGVWEQAMVNIGNGNQAFYPETRDCGRIIWDDKDLVAKIFARCEASVPEILELKDKARITGYGPVKRKETWRLSRLNERMRFLKYVEGNYFRPHCDGSFATAGNEEISWYTLHLYLNESDQDSQLEGGATTFHSMNMLFEHDVVPKTGRVLIFQHRDLLHAGADVYGGVKYTMRTDLMYKKVD